MGALPGENNCSTAVWLNDTGDVVGTSENGQIDPLTGFNQSRAVRWKDGEITDLGRFGGNQNTALGINNRGQIVGESLNAIPDPFPCFGFTSSTQCRAFLWQDGVMTDLGTLGTGTDAAAGYINERGQIAGLSSTSSFPNPVTGLPPVDPFLIENAQMIDLGTLGGAFGSPGGLNNAGQVIGTSSLASDPGSVSWHWEHRKLPSASLGPGKPRRPVHKHDRRESPIRAYDQRRRRDNWRGCFSECTIRCFYLEKKRSD